MRSSLWASGAIPPLADRRAQLVLAVSSLHSPGASRPHHHYHHLAVHDAHSRLCLPDNRAIRLEVWPGAEVSNAPRPALESGE